MFSIKHAEQDRKLGWTRSLSAVAKRRIEPHNSDRSAHSLFIIMRYLTHLVRAVILENAVTWTYGSDREKNGYIIYGGSLL
jgi:hypothetical protein